MMEGYFPLNQGLRIKEEFRSMAKFTGNLHRADAPHHLFSDTEERIRVVSTGSGRRLEYKEENHEFRSIGNDRNKGLDRFH